MKDHVPGAAAEVEDAAARRRREQRDRAAAPALVEAGGEDAIGDVVAGSDTREHLAHVRSLVAVRAPVDGGGSHGCPACFPIGGGLSYPFAALP